MRHPPPWPVSAPAASTQVHTATGSCASSACLLHTPWSSLDSTDFSFINCLYSSHRIAFLIPSVRIYTVGNLPHTPQTFVSPIPADLPTLRTHLMLLGLLLLTSLLPLRGCAHPRRRD
eukprot:1154319-Pelagomonas_calceolata.AAC.1